MYIVYYEAHCPIVGEYLAHHWFDDFANALSFARAHNGTLEAKQ